MSLAIDRLDRISIHALHEESDTSTVMNCGTIDHQFQSTLSMRRATRRANNGNPNFYISIHALHEESDGPASAR